MIQREMQMEPTQSILALTQPPLLGIRPGIGILAALITAVNDATIINHCIFFFKKRKDLDLEVCNQVFQTHLKLR